MGPDVFVLAFNQAKTLKTRLGFQMLAFYVEDITRFGAPGYMYGTYCMEEIVTKC